MTKYYERKTNRHYTPRGSLSYKQKYIRALLCCSKRQAKTRGIQWELPEDISIPETCPYLGIPLTFIKGKGHIQSNISIIRIDNTKGFTLDNVEVVSYLATRMKQEATKEQLITFAKNILKIVS